MSDARDFPTTFPPTEPAQALSRNGSADDAFAKAFAFTRAEQAERAGVHPYFKVIESQHGGTVVVDGREMVISGSNDYLGLTQDERLKTAARDALNDFGTSCTGSRFLTGTLSLHRTLEKRLASFLNKEAALTFSAGYLGALSVVSALAGRRDILYFDRENHACLYDGARLSFGTLRKYGHNDVEELDAMLARDADRPGGRIIVSDGVFSMSGHIARLPELVEVARRHGARLIIDDAHGTGVLGANGRGTGEHFGLEDEVDLIIGTFSKSFGSVGGFMAGHAKVVEYVKHVARPFMFTAALPAMQMASALQALDIIESEPERRDRLWDNVRVHREGMHALGFDTLGSETPIVPVHMGEDETAMLFWRGLWDAGVFTTPALPPGVPHGQAIIRTSVNANHTPDQLRRLHDAFASVGRALDLV